MRNFETITCVYALFLPDETFACILGCSDINECAGEAEKCELCKYKPFDPDVKMSISEIYPAISGEGSSAGTTCTIVRVIGCNLRCKYCDTVYAYEGGDEITVGEALAAVLKIGIRSVLFTGGEPLWKPEVASNFIRALSEYNIDTFVETNGSQDISPYKLMAHMVVDIKCPSSGMAEKTDWNNVNAFGPSDDIKFVVADEVDYEYAKRIMEEKKLLERTSNIYLSPAWPADGDMTFIRVLCGWMIRDRMQAKLSLQQHKIIYEPTLRGV